MGQQGSKPGKESYASNNVKLSQEDIIKLISASPFQPEDYIIKDFMDQKNQTHIVAQQMTEDQIKYVKRSVGRIIAKYPKKRRKTLKGLQSNQEIITNGTASFIGNNLLITAAHNIFLREYNQMASAVYFLPEMLNNSQSATVDLIPAQKYTVFEQYSNPQNEYTQKFDVALVVLQDHKFSSQTISLDIEWSYKRWEHLNPTLHMFGYPETLKNKKAKIKEMSYENKYISYQDEMIFYRNTHEGESGGPLVKLSSNDKGGKVQLVAVHKGVRGNNSVGLTLNSSQNTQEIIYQLVEKLCAEDKMKSYEFSCKKMREFLKKENVVEKLKELSKLKEENMKQKMEIIKMNDIIDGLKVRISILEKTIQKMKTQQQTPSTKKTKNEELKIQTPQKQIEQKLQITLYQHLERTISKEQSYYEFKSQKYYNKTVSEKEVEEETIKYMNYLKKNIKPLPPQHQQQFFFLIDIFDSQDKCIINSYYIHPDYKDSTCPAKFFLDLWKIQQRIDLKQFLSFNNWNHLILLSFSFCGWFNNDDWRALVECAANFNNLKKLDLCHNSISTIKEGDIEQFKSFEMIGLRDNPLSGQSKRVLMKIQQKNNNKITIKYSN